MSFTVCHRAKSLTTAHAFFRHKIKDPDLDDPHFRTVAGLANVFHLLGSRVGPDLPVVPGRGEPAHCFMLLEGPPSPLTVALPFWSHIAMFNYLKNFVYLLFQTVSVASHLLNDCCSATYYSYLR